MINVVVHQFEIRDFEDPDLCVANHLNDWENSEAGKWVMKHAVKKPLWNRFLDAQRLCYQYRVFAILSEQDFIIWKLKYE